MPRLEILVGMVGSGKSTYARRRADEGAIVISHDSLTEMLHARYRYEQQLRAEYRAAEEQLARTFLSAGRDVVIDRTHLTTESRGRWIGFAKRMHFGSGIETRVMAVTFPIESPEVHAQRRCIADARGRSFDDWFRVAQHHYEQALAEPLDPKAEGFDEAVMAGEKPASRPQVEAGGIAQQ